MQKLQHFIGQIHSLQDFTRFTYILHCMEFHKNIFLVIFSFEMLIGVNIINKIMQIWLFLLINLRFVAYILVAIFLQF